MDSMSEGRGGERGGYGNDKRRRVQGSRSLSAINAEQNVGKEGGAGWRVLHNSPPMLGLYLGTSAHHGPLYSNQNPYHVPTTFGLSSYNPQQQIYFQPQPTHSHSASGVQMDGAAINAMMLQQQFQLYQQKAAEQQLHQQFRQSPFTHSSENRNQFAEPQRLQDDPRVLQQIFPVHQQRNTAIGNTPNACLSTSGTMQGLQGSNTIILKEKSWSDVIHQLQLNPHSGNPSHSRNSSSQYPGDAPGNQVRTMQATTRREFPDSASSLLKRSRENDRKRLDCEDDDKGERPSSRSGLGGENRLSIVFDEMEGPGNPPQKFGKSNYIIPSALSGTHCMYSQKWRFRISQLRDLSLSLSHASGNDGEEDVVRLVWSITNVSSGTTVSMTETSLQAKMRQSTGSTICNHVFRNALRKRVLELQHELLNNDKTWLQRANIESRIKELSPKKCGHGLLFFGLRHAIVQQTIRNHMDSKQEPTLGTDKPS